MTTQTQKILLRRDQVAGRVPATSEFVLNTLVWNEFDNCIYFLNRNTNTVEAFKLTATKSFRSKIINGNFAVNARGASSSSTTYAANAWIMDRWRAGANGCTCSFAARANGDVVVTVTAGTIVQPIEGVVYLKEGGSYVVSQSGTALGRAYQGTASGSFVASPFLVTGWTAGTNGYVEFSTGTVDLVVFEPGTVPGVFERRDDELIRCRNYFRMASSLPGAVSPGTNPNGFTVPFAFDPPMRASPTIKLVNGSVNSGSALEPFYAQHVVTGLGSFLGNNTGGRLDMYIGDSFSKGSAAIIVEAGTLSFDAEIS